MIEEARSKCSFDIDDMSSVLYSKELLNKWIKVQEIIAKDPILQNNVEDYGLGREKLYEIYCKKAYRIHKLLNYSDDGIATLINCMFPQTIVTFLHQSMFIPTIKNLASEKQVDKWLPLCLNYQMIGCYAQTELGHGSDVQSLETTATYDRQADQFIMNSPTLTSTKWWIGDLGFTSNHCVAQAQLVIDGKNYGVQTFLVQLRDIETHLPQPGILLGDVGPKYGYNTKDNGYLRFNNVRIPRDNMLMRFAKVNKNGEFVQSQNEKIGYATMMAIRQIIIQNSALSLTQGLAIAIPYSFFRKQFKDAKGHEQYVIDYQTQQDKLIPLVADGFAQHFGAVKIKELLNENIRRVNEKMDFSMMGDLHALLSCCKAVYSWNTHFGLDKIRQSCGGHGYLQSSGIVTIQTEFAPSCTYEGENTVLLLQTARYLIKSLSKAMKKQDINQNVEYLYNITDTLQQNCKLERLSQLMCPETVRRILRQNAAFKVFKAASHLQTKAGEVGPKEAWNSHCGILLTEASIAHTHYWTIKNFLDVLMKQADENIKQVLSNLCCLYGIQRIIDHPQGYFESKFMNGEQLRIVLDAKERLFEILKPDLVGLMDSFKYHPNTLRSDLIAKNPYESLLNSARKSQVNNDQEFQIQLNEKLKQLQLNPKLQQNMQNINPAYVKDLKAITPGFLCPVNANTFNIQFLKFRIRDMDSGQVLFEVEREQDEDPLESLPLEQQDEARRIKYHFGPQFFELKTVGAQLTFSVGDKPVKNFTIIERHYFKEQLIQSYEFSFPFCIPNTTNTWEHIYTIPEINEDLRQQMIAHPYETKSDSFYFVGEQLVMHNKAEYDYSPFE